MRCPTDGAELVMAERQGVEVDYCPSCRGIWLDRGELDKILDRAAGLPPVGAAPAHPAGPGPVPGRDGGYPDAGRRDAGWDAGPGAPGYEPYRDAGYGAGAGYGGPGGYGAGGYRDGGYRGDRDRHDDRRGDGRRRRKDSWLGDLLDFD